MYNVIPDRAPESKPAAQWSVWKADQRGWQSAANMNSDSSVSTMGTFCQQHIVYSATFLHCLTDISTPDIIPQQTLVNEVIVVGNS